ncbi:MAG: Hsp20/alpha crystallin family protein [Firmicutes bacterium]|nr:Hsp20/alpha crystallin family protein [Bacillota bacterium]
MLYPTIFRNDLFDDIFDDLMKPSRATRSNFMTQSTVMKTDIKELEDAYQLDVELPGVKKENVTVELKDGALEIKVVSEVNNDEKDSKGKYLRRERFYGSCSRSFYVGEDVKQEDIKAKFDNGVLTITVPKIVEQPKVEQKQLINIE